MIVKIFPPLKDINLPNLVTSMGAMLGLVSFFLAANHRIVPAVSILPATIICDRLDGFLARRLHAFSDLGKRIDSFADIFNFCFLPVFIAYCSGFSSLLECVLLAVFFLAGLWRLSNFNVSDPAKKNGKPCFIGLATPYPAGLFVILFSLDTLGMLKWIGGRWCFGAFFLASAILLVSSVKIEKNGLLTRLFFLLTPIAVILLWIDF